jgi:hypothetical protein
MCTHFAAFEDVVPHRGAPEVNMEVRVAVFDGHEAVLLHLGVHHVLEHVGRLYLQILEVLRPNAINPVHLSHLFAGERKWGTQCCGMNFLWGNYLPQRERGRSFPALCG